jgi:spore coat protein CotH
VSARAAAAVLSLAALAACGGGGGGGGGAATTPSDPTAPNPTPIAGSAPIFNQSVLHEARLELDPSAWEALRRNYLNNQYYAANFSVDGVAVNQVGIRSRGSGSRVSVKPGLEIDFNRYVATQEYYGYKRLVLDNLTQDASFLRERLSFAVFEALGIAAPRNAFARLYVNGEYWGLYDLVEKVSKPFLESRLGEKSGVLFNYQWDDAWDFSWLGDDPDTYVPVPFEPETDEEKPGFADPLVRFIRAINESPQAGYASAMESWLDTNRFLTHLAVENAIAERDGLIGDQGLNNFYLYQYGGKDRFVFIPWDKDSTFVSGNWPLYRNLETNVLSRKLTADAAKRAYYADAVRRAVSTYVNERWLAPQLDTAWAQIKDAALADPHKPFSNGEVQAAVTGLRGVIVARESDVNAQR